MKKTAGTIASITALALSATLGATYAATTASASGGHTVEKHRQGGHDKGGHEQGRRNVDIEILAPENGDNAGLAGAGWFVDLELDFEDTSLAATGFTGLQLTGPAAHNNVAPFPGAFAPGQDDRMPGLVVLTSTTNATLPGFSGPGTNLAGLFNLSGVTDRSEGDTELWDTWIVGAPIAGTNVETTVTVAMIADLNKDGIYNDAPAVVPDATGDGKVDRRDLEAIGVASKVETVDFRINGDPA